MNGDIEGLRKILLTALNECQVALISDFPGKTRPDAPLDAIGSLTGGAKDGLMLKMELEFVYDQLMRQMRRQGLSDRTVNALRKASEHCIALQDTVRMNIGHVVTQDDLTTEERDEFGVTKLGEDVRRRVTCIVEVVGHPLHRGDYPRFASKWQYAEGIHAGLYPDQARRFFQDVTAESLSQLPIDLKQIVIVRSGRLELAMDWATLLAQYQEVLRTDSWIFPLDLSWFLFVDHGHNAIYAERDLTLVL